MLQTAHWGPLFSAIIAAVFSFLLSGLATWYARRSGLIDHPGERHSHDLATPRGGGAGLVAAFLISTLLLTGTDKPAAWIFCMLPGMAVISILGAWDDHRSLSVRFRLSIQLAVSVALVSYAAIAGWMEGVIPMVLGGFFVIWMTNLYNFMDGVNGMAAWQGIFGGLILAFLFHGSGDDYFAGVSLLLAACCAGFLPWNTGRAKVFLGDVGSLALGFIFAALLVYGAGTGAFGIAVAVLVMLLFLTDATLTLAARVIRRERWYNPHRQHLYQRLIAHGWTHGRVALFYQVINVMLILPGIVMSVRFPALAWAVTLVTITICVLGWLVLARRFAGPVQAG